MHNRPVTTKTTQDLLAAALEGAGVGIVVLDSNRRIVTANVAFCDLLGYSKDELPGLDITHDEAFLQELLAGTRTRYTIDKRYRHKSGADVWGRVTVTMLR